MPCKTPDFWYRQRGFVSAVLTPVSWLYQIGHTINQTLKAAPYKSSLPVICIGNAVAGGGGKTPTVLALTKLLSDKKICLLTRGYGGNTEGATLVDLHTHSAADAGDEALLLAQIAPTVICSDRAEGAKIAEQTGADLIIMDDGLQNRQLHKDITFLVIDRQIDFGNNKTIPAGPLREPLSKILAKTDAVICIGPKLHSDKAVFESEISPLKALDQNKKYIGFAGLALPDKFKNTLIDMNVNLIGWHPFPDHHNYTDNDLAQLHDEARTKGAVLVTTEKDHVRLPEKDKANIETLPIELQFKAPDEIKKYIEAKIG